MVRKFASSASILLLLAASLAWGLASAQTLYKYRGPNGEWIYADRPPAHGSDAEIMSVDKPVSRGGVSVTHVFAGSGLRFAAANRFHAPVEVGLVFESIAGVDYPHPDDDLKWVIPARSEQVLFELPLLGDVDVPSVQYRYAWFPGDPAAVPEDGVSYRAPFAVGTSYPVTQSYPALLTHATRDSTHAVDISMPIGTDIFAARGGIVFDVASTNFKSGPDASDYADLANLVRILHDDGTFAVYAHLNWNTIRVRPGDRVEEGQYIADSGNSGWSSGPHLHFAVQRNVGMRVDSLPVAFRGADGSPVTAARGAMLTAYR